MMSRKFVNQFIGIFYSQISMTADEPNEDFIPITTQPFKHAPTAPSEQN